MNQPFQSRYPGYDVMRKRDTPSWDDATREVVDARLAQRNTPRFCNDAQWRTLCALCAVIVPRSRPAPSPPPGEAQPAGRRWGEPAVPVAAFVDGKLAADQRDGYRNARLPVLRDAWRIGLAALDTESRHAYGSAFAELGEAEQRMLVTRMQRGELEDPSWEGMPCKLFFSLRVLHDIGSAYYAHPQAWNEIGFGGPANPRGYVRLQANRRDPWEPAEAKAGHEANALQENRRAR
jgi:hypothetical protein